MRRFGILLLAAGAAAAIVSAGSVATPSGDTCTTTGANGTYTLHINVAPNTAQYGFAFGAPGTQIRWASIPSANGDFAEGSKPHNTNGQWLSDTPLTGFVDVTLSTTGPVTGPITIVPGSSSLAHYWNPVRCATASANGTRGMTIVVDHAVTFVNGGWRLGVTVPSAGAITVSELAQTMSSSSARGALAKTLVRSGRINTSSAGHFQLMLRPSAAGLSMLSAGSSLKVNLHVAFDARSGGSASKNLRLTLQKTQM